MLKQRDIILIPIPFTDLASQKKRPAIIISCDKYNETNEDIVVVALTSNIEPRDFTMLELHKKRNFHASSMSL